MSTNQAIQYDKQIDREIEKAVSKFSQHLMSNAKWVRLIDSLVNNIDKVKKVEFKKVQNEVVGELYLNEGLTFGFDYWENGFEGCNSIGGWLIYKEIEYLIFPRIVNTDNNILQDLDQIVELMNSIGQFSINLNEDRLKLNCYL
ncbi:hypothetical protein IQ13_3535 [Lacibacter cauensis]|uniref:Uncharacterized protein n=1 Tax=Lacibacter cauensis TaxID=510947 RepID=A0A562SCQ8_9BACT|nr:hypothetical protein [Lacibacter cauensis]TWI79135.1 hypothetical protein IQ13_3535 [Lacibacter cauensis]